ncbi:folylpolyglutamate synthase/dihydrofolate synthase family protein [Psychrobacillus sp. OK032]|uniref:bifunctional folylpolyglutamate synthase/dihydrofolate synthase n=1 Tax=Psychrobacillus sp. OK032 TaxID=1884358 RepID=UPI0008B41A10|nr:folylpolyglutamate synthase/dihydrofolate synthase family protein [Psychrobacillus sp. OK032]SER85865.1 dihydrofolate synthase / folylpolyglutamate synthase [Psychrobacillus sp. OK032]
MEITNFNMYKKKWNIESETVIKPGLESIQKALGKLGNPQNKHRVIHVAGTNGKGSTIAFLSTLAKEHGLSYGTFTSPSIVDVHDQIQLNGQNVTEQQMDEAFRKMQEAGLSGMLTDFELLTVVAFLVFEGIQLDLVFIETGMGGRLDSTNVMERSIAVIPSISIDHTSFLGDTIEKISWHKAGIIKANSKLIIGALSERARNVVYQVGKEQNAQILEFEKNFFIQENTYTFGKATFKDLHPQMLGKHQLSNMALAITALIESGVPLKESIVQHAVRKASLLGRMEKVDDTVYFDGAHNEASIDALVETIKDVFPNKNIHFIVGILKDKDYLYMLRKLEEVASSFRFVNFNHERALPASILYKHCLHNEKSITKDISKIHFKNNANSDITIVTGSLYFITELRTKIVK